MIYEFCDCPYLNQEHYVETLVRLQDIFYLYKNEMLDEITDDELLHFMREQYETVCFGDLDYLEGTCLDIFAQAIRAGYRGYRVTDGRSEYGQFDEVKRWDYELYLEALQDLCWRLWLCGMRWKSLCQSLADWHGSIRQETVPLFPMKRQSS